MRSFPAESRGRRIFCGKGAKPASMGNPHPSKGRSPWGGRRCEFPVRPASLRNPSATRKMESMFLRVPQPTDPRPVWAAFARKLAFLAIAYNLLESLLSMGFGWADSSLALFGFGADSLIEVASSILVLWRLQEEAACSTAADLRRDRRATYWIGVLFLFLALGTVLGSALQLTTHRHPATTLPGLVVSTLSIGAMLVLWRGKRRAAQVLDSSALAGDAKCSLVCMQLSLVLFLGSLAFWVRPALWWAAAAAALVLSLYIGREGWEMVEAARKPDFRGGCGCH